MTVSPQDAPPPSLLRSVIRSTLFVLVAGIVGPAFIVIGLSLGDEPGAEWMVPTGIGITVVDLLVGFLIGRHRHDAALRLHRLRQNGQPALAQVLSFDQTGVRINDQPVLLLQMRIHGEDIEPYEVQAREVVPEVRIPLLYAGELPVLVDPETNEWEIDWASAKTVAPTAPAAPASAVPAPVDDRTAGERLAELDDLLRRDLVSRDEYDATRARIIAEL
ncbi:MAG: hypothetical protein NTX33_03125 [Propionibacteriales bacterium]|nr:hypothetical protein [Propionibacteriales bacterium]